LRPRGIFTALFYNFASENIMADKDRVEGSIKQGTGKVKETVGEALGDEKLKGEGKVDQVKGKVQNTVGGVKDKLRENRAERDDE
jgi:uncharacterized protein YjbJ (UPF0337 family)